MLFKVEKNNLIVDEVYIRFHKEFVAVLNKGLTNGGYPIVEKYFMYIYEIADYKSYSNRVGLASKKKHERAIRMSGLPDTFTPDAIITKAISTYKKLNYNRNAELLKDLENTLLLSQKVNGKIYKALETVLESNDLPREDIPGLIILQDKLFNIISGLPEKIRTVKQLQDLVYSELEKAATLERARGNQEILPSYDGDPEIEGFEES